MKIQQKPPTASTANGSQTKANSKLHYIPSQPPLQQNVNQPTKAGEQELFPLKPPTDLLADKEVVKWLINRARTDAGNAERFVRLFEKTLRYCKSRRKWLKWDGNFWKVNEGGEAQRAAIITARATKYAASFVKNNTLRTELE